MQLTSLCQTRLLLVAMPAALACTAYSSEAQRPTQATYALAGTDSVRVKRFLAALQSAIARDDSVAVSKLFQYPSLGVWDGHRAIGLQSPTQLLPLYRSVFNPNVRHLILSATLDSLWADFRGVTLGRGRLWFQIDRNGDPRIASIDVGIVRDPPARPPPKSPHNEEL